MEYGTFPLHYANEPHVNTLPSLTPALDKFGEKHAQKVAQSYELPGLYI